MIWIFIRVWGIYWEWFLILLHGEGLFRRNMTMIIRNIYLTKISIEFIKNMYGELLFEGVELFEGLQYSKLDIIYIAWRLKLL